VLLRASAAIALLVNCYANRGELSVWIQPAALLISLALFAGLLTPIAALTALVVHALVWMEIDSARAIVIAVVTLDAIALSMLGPGAYSVDGYRFGRRVVVLPPP